MLRREKRFLIVALLLLVGCSQPSRIATHGAASIKIYYFPEAVETREALSPAVLERSHLGYANLSDEAVASEAWSLAGNDIEGQTTQSADVRWGLIIQGNGRKTLASYFVDGRGTTGYASGTQVRFRGKLHRWLQTQLALFEST